jgi:hypothetical protein
MGGGGGKKGKEIHRKGREEEGKRRLTAENAEGAEEEKD